MRLKIPLIFIFLFLIIPALAQGEEKKCQPCPRYYCTANCDGQLRYTEPCCSGIDILIQTCSPWQRCDASAVSCSCSGECLETPRNPRYYENPTYSDQPDRNVGDSNIYLPVKLDWDDILGWGQPDGPQSYNIRIENATPTDPLLDILRKSDFIPPACNLKSNASHDWHAQACCAANGQNCGQESNWSFNTNLTPELISPADPDWQGSGKAEDIPTPVTLDWCDVKEAQSWLLRIYLREDGREFCHPWLAEDEDCGSWIIKQERREPEQIEKALYSDFFDEIKYFFTKTTTYKWAISPCLQDKGTECRDFGQEWSFETRTTPLLSTAPLSPSNDPQGTTPVGLPITLVWDDRPGNNSFVYEVNPGGITTGTTLSQASFDYPRLSLDTLYRWKVKPCWDYMAQKCEDSFTEEWYFRTTGRPPNLIYPALSASGIPIPTNLSWQDVPGAKSYIVKIWGDGLDLEKTLDKPDKPMLSLDYPEYNIRQETNYTWQVKTCAWENGQTCGPYSRPAQNFRTFRLAPPNNPSYPQNRGYLFTGDRFLSWENVEGAKAFQYQVKYLSLAAEEKDETCPARVGKEMFDQPKTALANSDFIELKCLGGYQWQVRSCLDANCQQTSNWPNPWTFTFGEGGTGQGGGGLVPCGRSADNPNTSWNEREPCQINHLFLSIKIIIDFLLLRAIPVILVLLTIATGLIFYTSLGSALTMAQVMSLWKAAGIGLGLIFFAWLIVNLFLGLIGYNVGIFGNWYSL